MAQCGLIGICSGCSWLEKTEQEQLKEKQDAFLRTYPVPSSIPFTIGPVPDFQGRDRLDLVLENGRLGLYSFEKKEIVDIPDCPAVTPSLNRWLKIFRTHLPQIKKGSLRLRTSPNGENGVWLDFSNEDIKRLLDEQTWLAQLSKLATIEIGQKRKRLAEKNGKLGLVDPTSHFWSSTGNPEKPIPLYTSIGSFTQSSSEAAFALADQVMAYAASTGSNTWLEFGAGAGTLTLPLLQMGNTVTAIEWDSLLAQGLLKSATENGFAERLRLHTRSFEKIDPTFTELLNHHSHWVLDPPRSGAPSLIAAIEHLNTKPQTIIYVSCFKESFAKDAKQLESFGYALSKITGIDQFPNTPHCEFITLWQNASKVELKL